MIIESFNMLVSFHDDFDRLLKNLEPLEALLKTITLAGKSHPSLRQFYSEDSEYLLERLRFSASELHRLCKQWKEDDDKYATLQERQKYIAHLSAYLGPKTLTSFCCEVQLFINK